MLHALVCVWNNVETISQVLTILSKIVDRIVILEGRWIGYEGSLRSTDGTIEKIWEFIQNQKCNSPLQIKFMMLTRPFHQCEARNILISEVPDGDWFMIIDSDEILVNFPSREEINELLKKPVKGYCFYMFEHDQSQDKAMWILPPRLLKKCSGMHLSKNHRYLQINNELVDYNVKDFPPLKQFIIHHLSKKKTREQAEKYKEWLQKFECYGKNP